MIAVCVILALVGAMPLFVFIMKRKRYRNILQKGSKITAEVNSIKTMRHYKGANLDVVIFWYLPPGALQYLSGMVKTNVGHYKRGQQFEIYYLLDKPHKYAVPGSKGEWMMLLFCLLIFLFVLFGSFKLYEMLDKENTTYQFSLPWKR
ncbi:MAG: DUF3592 domain-containing protein [Chitinophagaceae bacterium]